MFLPLKNATSRWTLSNTDQHMIYTTLYHLTYCHFFWLFCHMRSLFAAHLKLVNLHLSPIHWNTPYIHQLITFLDSGYDRAIFHGSLPQACSHTSCWGPLTSPLQLTLFWLHLWLAVICSKQESDPAFKCPADFLPVRATLYHQDKTMTRHELVQAAQDLPTRLLMRRANSNIVCSSGFPWKTN